MLDAVYEPSPAYERWNSFVPLGNDTALFRHFVVRSAGLPIEWLAGLALTKDALEAAEAVSRTRQDLQIICDQLEEQLRQLSQDHTLRKAIKSVRSDLKARRHNRTDALQAIEAQTGPAFGQSVQDYSKMLYRLEQQTVKATAQFSDGLLQTRTLLAKHSRSDEFQEALHLSNASLAENGSLYLPAPTEPGNSQRRRREVTATLYLQRLASKNETNAGFGPINLGIVVPEAHGLGSGLELQQRGRSQRKGYVAHWLVQDIATAISQDPHLGPLVPLVGAGLRRNTLLRCLEGVSQRAALQSGVSQETLTQYIRSGSLAADFRVPTDVVDQLAWLFQAVKAITPVDPQSAAAKQAWLDRLRAFDQDRKAFCENGTLAKVRALASAETRYAGFCDGPQRRNAGRMFRTRTMLYEECYAGGIVELPANLLETIEEDLDVLTFACRAAASIRQRREMEAATAFFETVFDSSEAVRFDRFLQAYTAADLPTVPTETERALSQAWTQVLFDATRTNEWDLSPLLKVIEDVPMVKEFDYSPDLLFSVHDTADAPLHVTLGEVHHGVTMDGWMLDPIPEGRAIATEIAQAKSAQTTNAKAVGIRMANLVLARHMKAAPQVYDGLVVELSGRAERDDPMKLSLADLQVVRGPDGLILRVAGEADERPIMFHAPAFGYAPEAYRPFALFSAPILALPDLASQDEEDGVAPEFTPDGIVLLRPRLGREQFTFYRRRWRLDPAKLIALRGLEHVEDRFFGLRDMVFSAGVPRYCFLKSASEPKPIFLDLDSPLLTDAALRTIRADDRVTLDEMLPGPEALWLGASDKGARTCEFRFLIMGGLYGT